MRILCAKLVDSAPAGNLNHDELSTLKERVDETVYGGFIEIGPITRNRVYDLFSRRGLSATSKELDDGGACLSVSHNS